MGAWIPTGAWITHFTGCPTILWVSLRQESSRKEEVTRTQKPFVATLRVNESRPAELGQQPEASFAWGGATLTAKRKQRVPMPCYRAPKYSLQEPPL